MQCTESILSYVKKVYFIHTESVLQVNRILPCISRHCVKVDPPFCSQKSASLEFPCISRPQYILQYKNTKILLLKMTQFSASFKITLITVHMKQNVFTRCF